MASSSHIELPEGSGSVLTMEYLGDDTDIESSGKRKEVNYESHMKRYEELIKLVTDELEKKKKKSEAGTRIFTKIINTLTKMQSEVPKVAKSMKPKRKYTNKTSGLTSGCKISAELAKFIEGDVGMLYTRSDISKAIYVYIHLSPTEDRPSVLRWKHLNPDGKRNLQDQTNKTRILPDKKLSKLLGYEQYRKDVAAGKIMAGSTNKVTKEKEYKVQTDDGLYYNTIQKLITRHIQSVETKK